MSFIIDVSFTFYLSFRRDEVIYYRNKPDEREEQVVILSLDPGKLGFDGL